VILGRVSGIEIRLHATFFLLVVLFIVAGAAPEGPGVPIALAWLVLAFTCVVVHELAHCFVGRTRGAVVHEIVLLPIGGVSKLEHLPERPQDELAMAVAGPAASLALAAVAGMAALAAGDSLLPVEILGDSLVAGLFWFNLLVAAFNLLPAFPLDGGRVLRALLERAYDLERATHVAATAGRTLAVAMILVGVLFNVWLVIIGIFVYFGASTEEAATIVHLRLSGRCVRDAMLREPVSLRRDTPVPELRTLLQRSAQRVFPVGGPAGYEGIVDARAIERAATGATVAEFVDRETPAISPSDDLEDRLAMLLASSRHALAVVDGRRVVGVLRFEDVQHLVTDDSVGSDISPQA
jgi:stage IV sporulation protein FB